ncbi:MAG: DUF4160 domain-containing protein [Sideroxydans sp.]|nr:DUF4160 domain-containing protein [Sideroxydans sp.]
MADAITIEIDGDPLERLRSSIQVTEFAAQTSAIPGGMVFLVDKTHGLRIEIRIDEHPPPHFHVVCQGEDASFSILDGRRLSRNRGLEKWDGHVRDWWTAHQSVLIERWNASRPTGCPVGPIKVPASNDRSTAPTAKARRKTKK